MYLMYIYSGKGGQKGTFFTALCLVKINMNLTKRSTTWLARCLLSEYDPKLSDANDNKHEVIHFQIGCTQACQLVGLRAV